MPPKGTKTNYRRKCLKIRDPEGCWICDEDGFVEVHHVDGNRDNNHIRNLVPLCRTCHGEVHSGESDHTPLVERLNYDGHVCLLCDANYPANDHVTHLAREHPDVIWWQWAKDDRGMTRSGLEEFIQERQRDD